MTTEDRVTKRLTEDEVLELIGQKITLNNLRCTDIIVELEKNMGSDLNILEVAFIENNYIEMLLFVWVQESLKKAEKYLEGCKFDTKEMQSIMNDIESIQTISDIDKRNIHTKISEWFRRRLDLILAQPELFSDSICAESLKSFKELCTDLIVHKCRDNRDENDRTAIFLETLSEFFMHVNYDPNREEILDLNHRRYLKDIISGKEFISRLADRALRLSKSSSEVTIRFKKAGSNLLDSDWTRDFDGLVKGVCRQLTFQSTTIIQLIKELGGRLTIEARGMAITFSRIMQQLNQLKMKNTQVTELRLVCTIALHIDCDLDNEIWHGTNVVIVTDHLYLADNKLNGINWDVSGLDALKRAYLTIPIQLLDTEHHVRSHGRCGEESGEDGNPGLHGLPGESGGNVYIFCQTSFNKDKWTIRSLGGEGGRGQNGGYGKDGRDGQDVHRYTKEEFLSLFPTPSRLYGSACGSAYYTLKNSVETRLQSVSIDEKGSALGTWCASSSFYKMGETSDGRTITASFHEFKWGIPFVCRRQTLVMYTGGNGHPGQKGGRGGKGGEGGAGGFRGKIIFEEAGQQPEEMVVPGSRDRAADGECGADGKGGKHGKHGLPAGDVGYTDCITNDGPKFSGFERRERLTVVTGDSAKDGDYIRTLLSSEHAGIRTAGPVQQQSTTQQGTQEEKKNSNERREEATKNNAVTSTQISVHVEHVKTMANQRINTLNALSSKMGFMKTRSERLDHFLNNNSKIGEKTDVTAKIHVKISQLMSQKEDIGRNIQNKTDGASEIPIIDDYVTSCTNCQHEKIEELDEVKELLPLSSEPTNTIPMKPSTLDKKPTQDDADNIFHCIFGELDSYGSYVCSDSKKHRNQLVTFIKKENINIEQEPAVLSAIERFVRGVEENEIEQYPEALNLKKVFREFESDMLKKSISLFKELKEELRSGRNEEFRKLLHVPLTKSEDDVLLQISIIDESSLKEAAQKCSDQLKKIIQKISAHKKSSQFDWKKYMSSKLRDEYTKYIQSPLRTLSHPELELIAFHYRKKIHIYCDSQLETGEEPHLTFITTLNPNGDDEHHVMFKEERLFQKLVINTERRKFQEQRDRQAAFCSSWLFESNRKDHQANEKKSTAEEDEKNSNFEKLIQVASSKVSDKQAVTYLKKLNPEFGVSKELFARLLSHYNNQKQINTADLRYLVEIVINSTVRKEDPVFYLYIVQRFCPCKWKYELLLHEIEDRILQIVNDNRSTWRRYLYSLGDKMFRLLRKQLHRSSQVTKEKLEQVLGMLAEKLEFFETDFKRLSKLSLDDWLFELKSKYWESKVNKQLSSIKLNDVERKEAVYAFLELENKKGLRFCLHLLSELMKSWKDISDKLHNPFGDHSSKRTAQERSYIEILTIMKEDNNTSYNIKKKVDILKDIVNLAKKTTNQTTVNQNQSFLNVAVLEKQQFKVDEFLSKFDKVVKMKMGFSLRDTQRVAIAALLSSDKKVLTQASTGEGKSLIVTGVAIAQALKGEKVDVITSSAVLATRDSAHSCRDGGVCDIYKEFGIDVANNCSPIEEVRSKAYQAHVVYGELANFQKDYLLDTFYDKNIKGERGYNSVIVDEVDCMLLDRGSNMLYLSHDIPGMEALESIYVFIWEKVVLSTMSLAEIKSAVLYDLYGQIEKEDLRTISATYLKDLSEINFLWAHLIQKNIIDKHGRPQIDNIREDQFAYPAKPELVPKLIYYFRMILERHRHILVPIHLLSFIERHLDTWITNAVKASIFLNSGEHYVVDQDRTNRSPDLNPLVTIIDPITGADLNASQWDGALHQFLQLKEGCQITMQSLKAVFTSNVSYIQKYPSLFGVTGTLGSEPERNFLKDTYHTDFMALPTAYPKKFICKPSKVMISNEDWMNAIVEEAEMMITKERRSILIFCRSINEVNVIQNRLKRKFTDSSRLHSYTRDYEKFEFESDELEIGHVIVATNLAGRGTDIKISNALKEKGGLHVCLTYLPENVRIEEQAMGRAGRKGTPGSGILILEETGETDWNSGKVFDLKQERNRTELLRISQLNEEFNNNLKVQELCFQRFSGHYSHLQAVCSQYGLDRELRDIICFSALDQWAFWLDSMEESTLRLETQQKILQLMDDKLRNMKIHLPDTKSSNILEGIINSVENFFTEDEQKEVLAAFVDSIKTPARLVTAAKHLAIKKKSFTKTVTMQENYCYGIAKKLLNRLIRSDEVCYPSAHYYKAFLIIKETSEVTTDVISELRKARKIINEHIQQQMYFSAVVEKAAASKKMSFYHIDAYKKQKENIIQLLEIYLDSINSILGGFCSVSGLVDAGINDENRADEVFNWLVNNRFITQCHVDNNGSNAEKIQQLANGYAVKKASIDLFLDKVGHEYLSEKEMEKQLKATPIFRNKTRKEFWKSLVDANVLKLSEDFIVLTKADCDLNPKLDQTKALQLNTKDKKNVILYKPFDLDQQDKLAFKKAFIKEVYGSDYKLSKKKFESNKSAYLEREKLKTHDLTQFGKLDQLDGFGTAENLAKEEWAELWSALVQQQIIENDGSAGAKFDTLFVYPTCPTYEHGINFLIKRTFTAERVRRCWIQSSAPSEESAINELPLNPHRNLLADLLDVQVVFAPTVPPAKIDEDELKNKFIDETECKRITSYLMNNRSTYACLETPDATLKPIEESITHRSDLENIAMQLYVFSLNGFEHTFSLNEKKWSAWTIFKSILVIVVGLSQVILGAVIEALSAGWMTYVATGLVSEGVSDILFGLQALISGNGFTWADYKRHKLASLCTTVMAIGIGAILSKGVSVWKYGWKTTGPGFKYGGKEVAKSVSKEWLKTTGQTITKQVIKSSAVQIGKGVGLGLVNYAVEGLVRQKMTEVCNAVAAKFISNTTSEIDKVSLKDTLEDMYRLHGPEEASRIISETKYKVLFGEGSDSWLQRCKLWIKSSFSALVTGLNNAVSKRKMACKEWAAAELVADLLSLFNKFLEHYRFVTNLLSLTSDRLSSFKAALKKHLKSDKEKKSCDDELKIKEFQDKIMDDIKGAMKAQAGQLVHTWTTSVLQQASTYVVTSAAKQIKKVYNNAKDASHMDEFRRLQVDERKRQENKENVVPQTEDSTAEDSNRPSEAHIKDCVELMKRTRNPKLFADIIREGVPLDRFGADALALALPAILHTRYPNLNVKDKFVFQIESTDGECCHTTNTSLQEAEVISIRLERAASDRTMGHYPSNSGSSNDDYNCLFTAVAEKIEEKYPQIEKLNANELRELTARMVETSPQISNAIRNGWHLYTIDIGFLGGRNPNYMPLSDIYEKLQEESRESKDERIKRLKTNQPVKKENLRAADHQPAKSHWRKYAKDQWIREIHENELPTLLLRYEDHATTLNFLSMANSGAFSKDQENLLRDGNYKEAIWRALDVNYIANLGLHHLDTELQKEHVNAVNNFFDLYANPVKSDPKGRSILTSSDVKDLKDRFAARMTEQHLYNKRDAFMTRSQRTEHNKDYFKNTYKNSN